MKAGDGDALVPRDNTTHVRFDEKKLPYMQKRFSLRSLPKNHGFLFEKFDAVSVWPRRPCCSDNSAVQIVLPGRVHQAARRKAQPHMYNFKSSALLK
jgi:hypothetical protein